MTAKQLIEVLAALPADAAIMCYYDSMEEPLAQVYLRTDGAVVLSHEPSAAEIMDGYEDGLRPNRPL